MSDSWKSHAPISALVALVKKLLLAVLGRLIEWAIARYLPETGNPRCENDVSSSGKQKFR